MPHSIHNTTAHHRTSPRPTFTIACWLLALIAFAQLITVGTARTLRRQTPNTSSTSSRANLQPDAPVHPRSLAEILASVGDSPSSSAPSAGISASPHSRPAPHLRLAPAAPAQQFPAIANPLVERLIQEARSLQMDNDIMRAMLKLDEAARIDPSEPAVIYHKALIFEEMGLKIKAADHYQKIQQMGIKAGPYFKLAADKLTKGMDTELARRPALSIGPMNTRKTPSSEGIKHADILITILARPDKPINPDDVHVQIHFYDMVNGSEIKKATSNAEINLSWTDTKTDWKDAGNEETLRASYTIPPSDLADEHLLGRREFYGYVVELLYKGEIVDQQASPRRLNSIHGSRLGPVQDQYEPLPWSSDDDDSLLPQKKDYGTPPPLNPPLPTR